MSAHDNASVRAEVVAGVNRLTGHSLTMVVCVVRELIKFGEGERAPLNNIVPFSGKWHGKRKARIK